MTDQTLRKLAEAATPGPWEEGYWDGEHGVGTGTVSVTGNLPRVPDAQQAGRNAAYIAAANPTEIIARLDEIDTLKVERDALAAKVGELKILYYGKIDFAKNLLDEIDTLKEKLEACFGSRPTAYMELLNQVGALETERDEWEKATRGFSDSLANQMDVYMTLQAERDALVSEVARLKAPLVVLCEWHAVAYPCARCGQSGKERA